MSDLCEKAFDHLTKRGYVSCKSSFREQSGGKICLIVFVKGDKKRILDEENEKIVPLEKFLESNNLQPLIEEF